MGQQNGKEPKRRPRAPPGGTGVRPSAVNDAVLQGTAASSQPRHVDPAVAGSGGDLQSNSSRNSFAKASPVSANVTYPIVLRYMEQDVPSLLQRKQQVYVAVEANGWQPMPMTPSTDSFYALLELPAGSHNYRFIVNGNEVVDSTQPLAPREEGRAPTATATGTVQQAAGVSTTIPMPKPLPPQDGKPANTIFLDEVLLATREDDDIMDNGQGWGQEEVMFEESRKYPPMVPLHLRYTPLNTPPTLVRCARDGRLTVTDGADGEVERVHPEHLPLPLSVTINHVYFQRREDHAVMGVTTRYCNKFTTVVYYTHLPSNPVDVQ